MIEVNANNFKEIISNNKKVILDLWAPWCGPCRMLGPVLEEVANENPDVVFGKVNVDENGDIAKLFNCMSIPMVLKFEEGKLVDQFVGFVPKARIDEFVK